MKLLTIFIFFTVLSVGYSQDFEIPALEFYTLEEAKKELIEQGEHYWCQTPTYLICQLLPRFRNYDYRVSELENLTPYRHLVDFEEIEATLNPYILRGSVLEIFQYNPFIGATLEQKEEFLQTHFPDTTWQEYLDDRFSNIYSYQKRRVLSAYSDGFLLISDQTSDIITWSNLRGDLSSHSYSYGRWGKNISVTSKDDAETILGEPVELIKTSHSLYTTSAQITSSISDEYTDIPEDFIWVSGNQAVGLSTPQLFEIVDEFQNPINILEDEVETRITFDEIAGVKIPHVQVMFNLIPIDSFE